MDIMHLICDYNPTGPIRRASSWSTSLHNVKAASCNERHYGINSSRSYVEIAIKQTITPSLKPRAISFVCRRMISKDIFQIANRGLIKTCSGNGMASFVKNRQNAQRHSYSYHQMATNLNQTIHQQYGKCPRNFSTTQDNGDVDSHKGFITCVAEQSDTSIETLTRRKIQQGKEMYSTQLSQCSNDKVSCVSSTDITSQFTTTSTGDSFEDNSIKYDDYLDDMQYADYKEFDQDDDVDDNESFVFDLYLADDNDSVISDLCDSIDDDTYINEIQYDNERLVNHEEADSWENCVFDLNHTHDEDTFISQVTTNC